MFCYFQANIVDVYIIDCPTNNKSVLVKVAALRLIT